MASILDRQIATSYVSSIVALALGIVLAVGVSAFFSLIGWGWRVGVPDCGCGKWSCAVDIG